MVECYAEEGHNWVEIRSLCFCLLSRNWYSSSSCWHKWYADMCFLWLLKLVLQELVFQYQDFILIWEKTLTYMLHMNEDNGEYAESCCKQLHAIWNVKFSFILYSFPFLWLGDCFTVLWSTFCFKNLGMSCCQQHRKTSVTLLASGVMQEETLHSLLSAGFAVSAMDLLKVTSRSNFSSGPGISSSLRASSPFSYCFQPFNLLVSADVL